MSDPFDSVVHRRLDCGLEVAVLPLPGRPVAAMEIRVFAGFAYESRERLGVAHVMEQALDKGTARRTGRELSDAFDAIGAAHGSSAGRENVGFSSLCLPEFLPQVIALHAEMIRTPSFPQDACAVAVELASQSLDALADDPGELSRKLICAQAYGDPLGRHPLGETETLERIDRAAIVDHWRRFFGAGRMQVSLAGAVEPERVIALLEKEFEGFGVGGGGGAEERPAFPLAFSAGRSHHERPLEQEQIGICFPAARATDADFPVEKVMLGVLAGGMSGRLFTEVREKRGLVYWVGAWGDHPRTAGVVHLGASCTPANVAETYNTLLREMDRLGEDLTVEEVDRAIVSIVARTETRGDISRAKAGELADDLFFFGRPRSTAEKIARIEAVSVDDVRAYLRAHPRDNMSVVTVGPACALG